jgi:hypothetical protein
VAASLFGVALLAGWVVLTQARLSPIGWTSRVAPLLIVGIVLGAAADRLRRSEAVRHRLLEEARRHQDAVHINDTILQGLSAAKWSLESGDAERALDVVNDTLEVGQQLVSDLIRDSGLGSAWRGPGPVPGR